MSKKDFISLGVSFSAEVAYSNTFLLLMASCGVSISDGQEIYDEDDNLIISFIVSATAENYEKWLAKMEARKIIIDIGMMSSSLVNHVPSLPPLAYTLKGQEEAINLYVSDSIIDIVKNNRGVPSADSPGFNFYHDVKLRT